MTTKMTDLIKKARESIDQQATVKVNGHEVFVRISAGGKAYITIDGKCASRVEANRLVI